MNRSSFARGLLPLCAALLVGACGGGDDPSASAPTTAPTATAEVPERVVITTPEAGQAIPARHGGAGEVTAGVKLRGRAAPDATVLIEAGCDARGCFGLARADETGVWRADIRVVARASRPSATIRAATSDAPDAGASVRVRLRASGKPPRRDRPGASSPSGPHSESESEIDPVTPPASTPSGAGPGTLLVVGDSLAEGTEDLLPQLLPGWEVRTDARRGRPLAEGRRIFDSLTLPPGRVVLALSLFTNDGPDEVAALEAAVRASAAKVGARGCAVWATIVRPPQGGVSYAAANRRLRDLAAATGTIVVVPWAESVARNSGWLAPDGVHATPEGYRARARLYAEAVRSCG